MEICYNSEKRKDAMKDKIFVTFLCATLCVVTNAMGAVGDGAGTCVVQEEVEWSGNTTSYIGGAISVKVGGAYIFIRDNEVLQCGGGFCDNGVEFKISDQNYVFRCTVTEGTGEWQHVALGNIPFCDFSEIKESGVGDAEYDVVTKWADISYGDDYEIDTKGFCVYSDCREGYELVVIDSEDRQSSYKCEAQAGGDGGEIEQLGKWLDDETEKFERSKWRDAEGKFNTARLASDSIAAVVLGTAGGLISSKVIKKKQVENGFEDIKCTIGSQEVADWGDEFQVGIQ